MFAAKKKKEKKAGGKRRFEATSMPVCLAFILRRLTVRFVLAAKKSKEKEREKSTCRCVCVEAKTEGAQQKRESKGKYGRGKKY